MNLRLLPDGRVLLDSQRIATITPDNVLQTANGHAVQCSGILDAMQKLATYPIKDWIVNPSRSVPRNSFEMPTPTHARWTGI